MLEKIERERKNIVRDLRVKLVGYLTVAFGFVAALAWNDAIRALIEYYIDTNGDTITAKLVYAAIVTVVTVVITYYLSKTNIDSK